MTKQISEILGNSYIACVDIEATCDDQPGFDRSSMEIIEFGLTLLNPEYKVVGTMNTFVRPTINPILTKFCKELTTITQEQVDTAQTWDEVAPMIAQFFVDAADGVEDFNVVWTSWGDFDKNKIGKECIRCNVPNPMPKQHYNLKFLEAAHRNSKKQHGLNGTLANMAIVFPGTLHRACDDAMAVALVLQQLGPGLVRSKL